MIDPIPLNPSERVFLASEKDYYHPLILQFGATFRQFRRISHSMRKRNRTSYKRYCPARSHHIMYAGDNHSGPGVFEYCAGFCLTYILAYSCISGFTPKQKCSIKFLNHLGVNLGCDQEYAGVALSHGVRPVIYVHSENHYYGTYGSNKARLFDWRRKLPAKAKPKDGVISFADVVHWVPLKFRESWWEEFGNSTFQKLAIHFPNIKVPDLADYDHIAKEVANDPDKGITPLILEDSRLMGPIWNDPVIEEIKNTSESYFFNFCLTLFASTNSRRPKRP